MFKKILFGIFVCLLLAGLVVADYRREIYDYDGSWARQKVNYSIISAINFSGERADFNDGWLNGGLSIINGSIYAQVGYFYNITSLNVTKQNLTILDNLFVEGNVTAENVWIPTYIFAYTNNTIPVAVTGIWYNITFDEEEYPRVQGITHTYNDATNYSFYVTQSGIYEVFGSLSIIDTSVNAENHIMVYRFVKNGEEIHGSIWEGDFSRPDAASKRNFNVLVDCSAGDWIGLQFTGSDTDIKLFPRDSTGYGDHHAHSAAIKIKRIA